MNIYESSVMVDGKPVMTQQAVWELMMSLQNISDRARTIAKIAVAISLASLGVNIWLGWMLLQHLA